MERYKITDDSAVYYFTFSVIQWLPLFVREEPSKIVTESLNFCVANKGLFVGAYVIMPTHVHAVLADREMDSERLSATVNDLRKFTGRRLADYCDHCAPSPFRTALREQATADRDRRLWQPSRHAEAVHSESFLTSKIEYLHNNPVRAGLVRSPEHWRFSSAAQYASGCFEEGDVIITCLHW